MTTSISDSGLSYSDTSAAPQIFSIAASVAGNALTLTLQPTVLSFRSSSLSTGGVTTLNCPQLTVTVPSGATLGTTSGTAARLVVLAVNNAGAPVLCVANSSFGTLDETGLVSPTTISTGATSSTTVYSASGVGASLAYRVVGYIDITESAAGQWSSAPTGVFGAGSANFSKISGGSGVGVGQTWQDVTSSRAKDITYYNTTGKPIMINVYLGNIGASSSFGIIVDGQQVNYSVGDTTNGAAASSISAIIPPGSSYRVSGNKSMTGALWTELR